MPQSYKFDLVCIDCRPAGHRAAIQAAKFGKQAAVADPRQLVDGTCAATNRTPRRALRILNVSLVVVVSVSMSGAGALARESPLSAHPIAQLIADKHRAMSRSNTRLRNGSERMAVLIGKYSVSRCSKDL